MDLLCHTKEMHFCRNSEKHFITVGPKWTTDHSGNHITVLETFRMRKLCGRRKCGQYEIAQLLKALNNPQYQPLAELKFSVALQHEVI